MQNIPELFNDLLNEEDTNYISKQIDSYRYFFGDLHIDNSKDFCVACAGVEECKPDYYLNRKGFIYYAIEYLPQGDWLLECDGKKYNIKGSALFAYSPKTNYKLTSKNKKPTKKYFIDFVGKDSDEIIKDSSIIFGNPLKITHTQWLNEMFSLILSCDTLTKDSAVEVSTSLLRTILNVIKSDVRKESFYKNKASYQKFIKCKIYVNENFLKINSIDEITQFCGIEDSYLSRVFNKYEALSPIKYLQKLKIRHALDLMIRRGMNVKEVSSAVGFKDQYHFSKVFKRIIGVSPKKYTEAMHSKFEE